MLTADITSAGATTNKVASISLLPSVDTWLKFDDEIVSSVKTQDILALRGGGDWHMAYICVYRKLQTKVKVESPRAHPSPPPALPTPQNDTKQ